MRVRIRVGMRTAAEAMDSPQPESSTAAQAPKKPAAVVGRPVEGAAVRYPLEAVVGHLVEGAAARFRLEAEARRGVRALRTVKAARHMWEVPRRKETAVRRKETAVRRRGRVRHRRTAARHLAPKVSRRKGPLPRPPSLPTAGAS